MEAVNGVSEGGPPPPSPLTGCYLLIVIGEPHSQEHKDIILRRVAKGLLSWDISSCLVDLEKELAIITEQAPDGEEARYGERLIQYASENLVTEILIHPAVSTLSQCVRNLLSSFTRHRHIIHSGYTFAANGSWALQDGTFSLADFSEAFQELEVQRVIRAYENSITVDIHCAPEGDWLRLPKEPYTKNCIMRLNPVDVLPLSSPSITNFLNYISPFLISLDIETALESSEVVGNIRFSHPTLYVFPGGQGDAALFGINGFNMLLDGGFSRKACFWDFVRHLDRLDAVLLTRLNNSNVCGISSVLQRKRQNAVYPQIGHFFSNIQERKALSPDGDKDKDPLIINLLDEGQKIVTNLKYLNLSPQSCYRDSEPINLYHKVGHGTLDMYVLNPAKESKEVKDFLQKWNNNDSKLFSNTKTGKDFIFPLSNLVSVCALLVWQPSNPSDNITRILFPGSTPQGKIFEGLDKLRQLECIKYPVCSEKSLNLPTMKKTKESVLDKIIPTEKIQKIIPDLKREKMARVPDNKQKSENKQIDSNIKNGMEYSDVADAKIIKKSDSVESDKSTKPQTDDKLNGKTEDKPKPKPKVDTKQKKIDPNKLSDRKPKALSDKKASPTTPKKTMEKLNGDSKENIKVKTKFSPSSTPAKSTKEATNRKVFESKKAATKKESPKLVADKKEAKADRKPISRRPKPAATNKTTTSSPVKKVQKPDSIAKKAKLDKEGTTDSSTVSTPSADQDNKRDLSKLTAEEIEQLKAQELADLKEEQEVVQEIEAVFRKGEKQDTGDSDMRKIKNISIEEKTDEEYLIVEKEIVEADSTDKDVREDEIQKLTRDSEESEKQRKLSIEDKESPVADGAKVKERADDTVKELPITSPEDKLDSEKKAEEEGKDGLEQVNALESQPDEKFSATIESGATTAPTLPEDERIPLDEIKEDIIDQAVEEKHVKEETKEKEVPLIQLPSKTVDQMPKLPPVVGIRLDKQSHIRDIVKTPDEVADLPVHEVADHYVEFQQEEVKSPKDLQEKKKAVDSSKSPPKDAAEDTSKDEKESKKSSEEIENKIEAVSGTVVQNTNEVSEEHMAQTINKISDNGFEKRSEEKADKERHTISAEKESKIDQGSDKDIDEGIEEIGEKCKEDNEEEDAALAASKGTEDTHHQNDVEIVDKTTHKEDSINEKLVKDIHAKPPIQKGREIRIDDEMRDSDEGIEDITEKEKDVEENNIKVTIPIQNEEIALTEKLEKETEHEIKEEDESVEPKITQSIKTMPSTAANLDNLFDKKTDSSKDSIKSEEILGGSVITTTTEKFCDENLEKQGDTLKKLEKKEDKLGETKLPTTIHKAPLKTSNILLEKNLDASNESEEEEDKLNDKMPITEIKSDETKLPAAIDKVVTKTSNILIETRPDGSAESEEEEDKLNDKIPTPEGKLPQNENQDEHKSKELNYVSEIAENGEETSYSKIEKLLYELPHAPKDSIQESHRETVLDKSINAKKIFETEKEEKLNESISKEETEVDTKLQDVKGDNSSEEKKAHLEKDADEVVKETILESKQMTQQTTSLEELTTPKHDGSVSVHTEGTNAIEHEEKGILKDANEEVSKGDKDISDKGNASILEEIKHSIKKNTEEVVDNISEINDSIKDIFKGSVEAYNAEKESAIEVVSGAEKKLEDTTTAIIKDIKDAGDDVKEDKIVDSVEAVIKDIKEIALDIKEDISSSTDTFKEKCHTEKEEVVDVVSTIEEKVKDTTTSIIREIKDEALKIKDVMIEDSVKDAIKGIKETADNIRDDVISTSSTIKEKCDAEKENIVGAVSATEEIVRDTSDAIIKDIKDDIDDITNIKIKDSIEAVIDDVKSTASYTKEGFITSSSGLKEKCDTVIENIIDTVSGIEEKVKDTTYEIIKDIKEDISSISTINNTLSQKSMEITDCLVEGEQKEADNIDIVAEISESGATTTENIQGINITTIMNEAKHIEDTMSEKSNKVAEEDKVDTSVKDIKLNLSETTCSGNEKKADNVSDEPVRNIEIDYDSHDLPDSSEKSFATSIGLKDTEFIDKADLGRKSPKEREQDVAKIVASVAEVLKSEAPLEEFEGKIPLEIKPFSTFTSYTTELRETHITTVDSPSVEIPCGISTIHEEEIHDILEDEEEDENKDSNSNTTIKEPTKISVLIKNSNELLEASSKMINEIKSSRSEPLQEIEKGDPNTDKSDSSTVHRMLVTASSEDGGEETIICPAGSITFSKSVDSSGRTSPELSKECKIDVEKDYDEKHSDSETTKTFEQPADKEVLPALDNKESDEESGLTQPQINGEITPERNEKSDKMLSEDIPEKENKFDMDLVDAEKLKDIKKTETLPKDLAEETNDKTDKFDMKDDDSECSEFIEKHETEELISKDVVAKNIIDNDVITEKKVDICKEIETKDKVESKVSTPEKKCETAENLANRTSSITHKDETENQLSEKSETGHLEHDPIVSVTSEKLTVESFDQTKESTPDDIKNDFSEKSGKTTPDSIKLKDEDNYRKTSLDVSKPDESETSGISTPDATKSEIVENLEAISVDSLKAEDTNKSGKSTPDLMTKDFLEKPDKSTSPDSLKGSAVEQSETSVDVTSSPGKLTPDPEQDTFQHDNIEQSGRITPDFGLSGKYDKLAADALNDDIVEKSGKSSPELSKMIHDEKEIRLKSTQDSPSNISGKSTPEQIPKEITGRISPDIMVSQDIHTTDSGRTTPGKMKDILSKSGTSTPDTKPETNNRENVIDDNLLLDKFQKHVVKEVMPISNGDLSAKDDEIKDIVEVSMSEKTSQICDVVFEVEGTFRDSKFDSAIDKESAIIEKITTEKQTIEPPCKDEEINISSRKSSSETTSKEENTQVHVIPSPEKQLDDSRLESVPLKIHLESVASDSGKSTPDIITADAKTDLEEDKQKIKTDPLAKQEPVASGCDNSTPDITTTDAKKDLEEEKEKIKTDPLAKPDAKGSLELKTTSTHCSEKSSDIKSVSSLPDDVSKLYSAHIHKELLEETITSSAAEETAQVMNGDVIHDKTTQGSCEKHADLKVCDLKDSHSGKSTPEPIDSRKSSILSIKDDFDSRKFSITSENTKTSSILSGRSTPEIREDIDHSSRKSSAVSGESFIKKSSDGIEETIVQSSISIVTSSQSDTSAGPSINISPSKNVSETNLSGKSTPDIADIEKIKEMQEILKHEKHIPGSSTPPTVPVSPIVKDITVEHKSDILDAAKTVIYSEVKSESDEDVPSTASQAGSIGKLSTMDQMNTSIYGTLPSDEPDIDYNKAVQEHQEARGESLIKPEEPDLMTSSFIGILPSSEKDEKASTDTTLGKPLGLPSPAPPNDNKGTPKKERKLPVNVTVKNKLNDDRKRSESPKKQRKINPVYVDLTYVPHHGNSYYTYVDFFRRVRARYYVFSGIEPSKEVYNALLEAKQQWEDKDLEVTIIPTYDTDVLGYWVAENEELLTKHKIDLSPSASRCTINLQDHETSCSAYRLEF